MIMVDHQNWEPSACAAAVGFFDGVHLGHAAVLRALAVSARDAGLPSVAVCFEQERSLQKRILSAPDDRASMIEALGPDYVVTVPWGSEAGSWPDRLLEAFLQKRIGAKIIVSGHEPLEGMKANDVDFVRVHPVLLNGLPVTTERILRELQLGHIENVNHLLGRPHHYFGKIVPGAHRGRTVGMPTANMAVDAGLQLPGFGVYGTLMKIRGRWYKGLTNIGTRPSADTLDTVTVETYLLGFDGLIYGEEVELEVYAFVRNIIKFDHFTEVKAQVDRDIVRIQSCLDSLVDEQGNKR